MQYYPENSFQSDRQYPQKCTDKKKVIKKKNPYALEFELEVEN